jgi:UDP-N-acetylmuramoyl-L-alanyl-D-glutamate--2,6-diaminopimelate ligase
MRVGGWIPTPPGCGHPEEIAAFVHSGFPIHGLTSDSRKVKSGMTFVAYPGDARDGRDFISQAVSQGASSVIWEEEGYDWNPEWHIPQHSVRGLRGRVSELASEVLNHPSRQLQVLGVTGTNGKTTCSHWLAQLLMALNSPCAVLGTLGNGPWPNLEPAQNTTADPIELQNWLERFRLLGMKACAMEVSSHGLDQNRVTGVQFTGAIFTNLSRDHLDYHGSFEAYGRAKAMLFQARGLGFAVINLDDPFGLELVEICRGRVPRVVGYSVKGVQAQGCENLTASRIGLEQSGLAFTMEGALGQQRIHSTLLGEFNLSNLLAVMATLCLGLGYSLQSVAAVVPQLQPPKGRLERLQSTTGPTVVIDYAHTPDALEKALVALRPLAGAGRLVCVFGCGGNRDAGKRPLMGALASRLADQVVLTNDNPRGEDPEIILDQIEAGITGSVMRVADRKAAIASAIGNASSADVILIAGKGHEDYQEVRGERLPFSDHEVARESLAQWGRAPA